MEVIRQQLCYVDRGNKTRLLAWLLEAEEASSALVFTRTKHGANKVAGELGKAGIPAAAIHGNKSQTARQQALADFKAGRVRVLVATDIAARGLDIEELSHVFNYNLPDVPETYVHRIGRTGRAGHGGVAISFCDINEKEELKAIEKLLGRPIPVLEDHPWPMEVLEPLPRDKKGRVVNPEDAEARAAARERKAARTKARQEGTPAPEKAAKAAGPVPEEKPKRARGRRASATLEEALTATAPRNARPAQRPPGGLPPSGPSGRGYHHGRYGPPAIDIRIGVPGGARPPEQGRRERPPVRPPQAGEGPIGALRCPRPGERGPAERPQGQKDRPGPLRAGSAGRRQEQEKAPPRPQHPPGGGAAPRPRKGLHRTLGQPHETLLSQRRLTDPLPGPRTWAPAFFANPLDKPLILCLYCIC